MQTPMHNQICIVTGATSGMGKATAAALAQKGATVILIARDQRKGETVRDAIRTQSGNKNVEVIIADLASQHSLPDTFRRPPGQAGERQREWGALR